MLITNFKLCVFSLKNHQLTRASATAASTSVPVFRTLMALTDAEILAWCTKPYRSANRNGNRGQ